MPLGPIRRILLILYPAPTKPARIRMNLRTAIRATVPAVALLAGTPAYPAAEPSGQEKETLVYVFPIREDIMPSAVRLTAKALAAADEAGADIVVIDMNTYGGLLDAADSIRTMVLEYPKPVLAFVNNQAASAGALIALAADSIYMRPGASMGAATVVNQSGEPMPDKYQSFMRSMMRSTAEAHGKIPDASGGDTVWRWRRDPHIAEAMVDADVTVAGISDSSKVLTLTPEEARRVGYSEGTALSVDEVLAKAGINGYEIRRHRPTFLDRAVGYLSHPAVHVIFKKLIIGAINFELQTPGIGFPLVAAILGAALYFAPLYLEGLVKYWELILFVAGIGLILVEVFVTPGFGVPGILGIAAVVLGLPFALIDTSLLRYIPTGELPVDVVLRPLLVVVISAATALVLSIWLGRRFLTGGSRLRKRIVLESELDPALGYVSRATSRGLVGKEGVARTALRPAGKVTVEGVTYEAAGEDGMFIERGVSVTVVRDEGGVLYCRPAE